MGLVPWLCYSEEYVAPQNDRARTRRDTSSTADTPAPPSPDDATIANRWIHAGESVYGQPRVLVLLDGESVAVALPSVEARLLGRMFQAVGVSDSDYRLATLAAVNDRAPGGNSVADALTEGYDVLVRLQFLDDPVPVAGRTTRDGHDRCVPTFSLPHPESLLHQPSEKRRAWLALKAIGDALSTSGD